MFKLNHVDNNLQSNYFTPMTKEFKETAITVIAILAVGIGFVLLMNYVTRNVQSDKTDYYDQSEINRDWIF